MAKGNPILKSPDSAGQWRYRSSSKVKGWSVVTVSYVPTSGRFCRALQMGGCAEMGYGPWKGDWQKVEPITPRRKK